MVLSVLFESLLVAAIGGVIGGGLAYLAFDGFRAATINFQSFSQIAFAFDVNATLLRNGILYALLIGLVGGLALFLLGMFSRRANSRGALWGGRQA